MKSALSLPPPQLPQPGKGPSPSGSPGGTRRSAGLKTPSAGAVPRETSKLSTDQATSAKDESTKAPKEDQQMSFVSQVWGDLVRVVWGDLVRVVWGDMVRVVWDDMVQVVWGDMVRVVWGDMVRVVWGEMVWVV